MKMNVVLQHDECDCGAACLCMIAGYYGLKLPVSNCRELTKTDQMGTNLYGIVDGAEQIGLEATALAGTREEFLEGVRNGEVSFPFVAHLVTEEGLLHFVVVTDRQNGKFYLNDPAKGKCALTEEHFFEQWTGNLVIFQKGAKFKAGNFTQKRFVKFLGLLKGCEKKCTGVLFLSLLTAGMGIAGTFVFRVVIDGISEAKITFHQLNVIFGALAGLYLLQAVIQFVRGKLIVEVSRKIDIELSVTYYRHLLGLPVSTLNLRQTGDYISRLSDADKIRQVISEASVTIALDSVMVVVCGWILFQQSRVLFGISLGMVFLYVVVGMLYRKPIETSNREAMEKKAVFQAFFKESMDGAELIRATGSAKGFLKKSESKMRTFADAAYWNSMASMSQGILAEAVELAGTILILWFGFQMVAGGILTLGTLITFYALLAYFTQPIKNLAELQPMIQSALVAAERLNDVLELQAESENENGEKLDEVHVVEFSNIDFRYGNRELTLKNVSFSVAEGEKIAIVGESGSGKTSLAKLLLRFYEPEQGEIKINGVDVRKFEMQSLRNVISYVSQEEFFFSGSVKECLLLGQERTPEEIKKACETSGADRVIKMLPYGEETPMEENGKNLSGGQRQKIAIARALLRKPQLLILDEATSHLDAIAEEEFRNRLMKEWKGLTCIMISHRLSMVKDCDKIFVLENGTITESGTHKELMKKGGLYRKMWDSQ